MKKHRLVPQWLITLALIIALSLGGCTAMSPTPISTTVQPSETVTTITTSATTVATTPSATETATATSLTELRVHFIDVGQGDAILLDCGEYEVLIDAGDGSPDIVPYLAPFVDGSLEIVIATHPHADHIGGLDEVLAAFDVGQVWHNGDTSTSQTYERYMACVNGEGCEIHDARRGDTITAGPMVFTVLHPVDLGGSTNNNSVVVSLSYGDIDFLFTGDAEVEAEAAMLVASDIPVPDVEILKVGHHGSSTASSPDFLSITTPEVAIYSCALGNSYGHPHTETIAALNAIGAQIYGTETYGTVVVTTDGTSYHVQISKSGSSPTTTTIIPPTTTTTTSTTTTITTPTHTTTIVDTVYITNTGAKYHRSSCRYLSSSKIPISRADAIADGYTPCSVCKP